MNEIYQVDVDDKIVLVLGSFLALFPLAFFPLNMTPGGGWFSSLGSSRAPSWHVWMRGRSTSLSLYDYTLNHVFYLNINRNSNVLEGSDSRIAVLRLHIIFQPYPIYLINRPNFTKSPHDPHM